MCELPPGHSGPRGPNLHYRNPLPAGQEKGVRRWPEVVAVPILRLLRSINMRNPRFLPVAVLAIALSALAGGLFGSRALARQDEVSQQYRVFTSALDAIEREYVDDV